MNGTQTLMTTPGLSSRKSNSAANTIRKIFGSSTQRKVIEIFRKKNKIIFFSSLQI